MAAGWPPFLFVACASVWLSPFAPALDRQRLSRHFRHMALNALKTWARRLKRDVVALWLAARDRRTPALARVLAAFAAAYALSPIDLIPDFVPVLGYLDDLLLVPLAVLLAVRLIPSPLMAEFRRSAEGRARPVSRTAMVAIIILWGVACLAALVWLGPGMLAWLRA